MQCTFQVTDHPRSRGEYFTGLGCQLGPTGSSPLSRGIHGCGVVGGAVPRIIPALAGNTPASGNACSAFAGSSPLSRGIQKQGQPHLLHRRIIPALAGNTGLSFPCPDTYTDHPRSRGEYPVSFTGGPDTIGSSPLSRGIPFRLAGTATGRRIIPALAGNTLADKGFYQLDLSDLGNPLLARLRFSKSLAPRLRRPSSWRGESSGSSSEGPGRTIRVSPS